MGYLLSLSPYTLKTLHTHAKSLSSLASSSESWKSGSLSSFVHISAPSTLATLQQLWSRWADESLSVGDKHQERLNDIVIKATGAGRKGISALNYFCLLPSLRLDAITALSHSHNSYWAHGTADESPDEKNPRCVNPPFVSTNGTMFAHYATDPLIGFHLSTWGVDVTAGSTLTGGTTLADAAKQEFAAWLRAFEERRKRAGDVFRFVTADALTFCHLVQSRTQPKDHRLACFVDHWHFEHLSLYKMSAIPETFTVVDTSNLIDRLGGLNLLVAASPLLERSISAALYTEHLLSDTADGLSLVEKSLQGEIGTISTLLGLFPAEHYTNAAFWSSSMVTFIMSKLAGNGLNDRAQIQLRMMWRRAPGHDIDEPCTLSSAQNVSRTCSWHLSLNLSEHVYLRGSFHATPKSEHGRTDYSSSPLLDARVLGC